MEHTVNVKEGEELELLEQAFLLLGLAESDEQLEKIVKRFLCPVILKMSSDYLSVRNKVMELLNHISKRLNNRCDVELPVKSLIDMLQEPLSTPMIKNFALVYLKIGFNRLPPSSQVDHLSLLINILEEKSPQQMDSILQLYTSALVHLVFPVTPNILPSLLPLKTSANTRKFVLEFLLYVILLPYSHRGDLPPPGMTNSQVKKVNGEKIIEQDILEKMKMSILKLLCSGVCETEEIVCHLMVGASDSRHSVADYSDNQWKQLNTSTLCSEKQDAVLKLFHFYLGSADKVQKTDSSECQSPANLRFKLLALKFFVKSTCAANHFPFCIQVVFESLFGIVTNARLKTLSLEFIIHIINNATSAKLHVMSPILLTGLNKMIDMPESKEEKKLLLFAYTAIGLLAKKSPLLFRKDPKHILKLFEALQSIPDKETMLAVQECLSTVAVAYRGVDDKDIVIIEAILLNNITHKESHARRGAAYCSRVIFPFSHIPSRYVSLLACGDVKDEVKEEGKKGLLPNHDDEEYENLFPGFEEMIEYIYKRAEANMSENGTCYSVATCKLPFHPSTMSSMLTFLHQCLLVSAQCLGDAKNCDLSVPLEKNHVMKLKEHLSKLGASNNGCLDRYLTIIRYGLSSTTDADLLCIAVMTLLHTVLSSPPRIATSFLSELHRVKGFTQSAKSLTRESAARIIGHLVYLLPQEQAITFTRNTLKDTYSTTYVVQRGSLITLGHVSAVCNQYSNTDASVEIEELVQNSLSRIMELLSETWDLQLVKYACVALGEICRSGPLPIKESDEINGVLSKQFIIKKLRMLMKETDDVTLKEKCAASLGLFFIGDTKCPYKELILQSLLSLKEKNHIDLQFSVGESLSCLAAGKLCDSAEDPWNYENAIASPVVMTTGDDDMMEIVLKTVVGEYAFSTAPIVRQSACIWMLSILKKTRRHPFIQGYLKNFQIAFLNLLSDSNDTIQEVASRGLVLVYELSDSTQKESLVQLLVGTLMEGRRAGQPISEDSKLFDEGALGKTPQGSNITTYKELCSLASDLNQPDLVYKFMHLANHSALWNSKKGAAFGVTGIATHAKEQLKPHLPLLVPKLFQYKYDPLPRIQLAMSNIWDAIVPESKKIVEQYYNEIISGLITNLSSNQWRNREASCLALRDLMVVYPSSKLFKYLSQLWELCLRARDDIKETVRKAAESACKSLLHVTIKTCENTSSESGSRIIASVLPVLIKNMTTNSAQNIRGFSLLGIVKIADKAGPSLKPHIPQLVPVLLESMSLLEPQILNTLSFQLVGDAKSQEEFETLRVAASKTSPTIEACNLCIPHMDPNVLTELVPQLVTLLKTGVGLGTKVAVAQFLINVVLQKTDYLAPYAGKLLAALLSGLSDRSATVRKTYAKAVGHYVKIAKDSTVSKLIDKLKKMYYENKDSGVHSALAHTVLAMTQYSSDTTKGLAADLAPLVFLAMQSDVSDTSVEVWKEAWEDLVPNTAVGVKMYLQELMTQISPNVSSQSWEVKRQAASALSIIAGKMGSDLGPPHLATLLKSLIEGLQGRTWDGKEILLTSLRTVCISCSSAIIERVDKNQPNVSEIISCLFTQCKKHDIQYKTSAIETTAHVINHLKVDVFIEFYEILLYNLRLDTNPKTDEHSHTVDLEEQREMKLLLLELQVKVYAAIGLVWPSHDLVQRQFYHDVCVLLSNGLPDNNWKLQVAILTSLTTIYEKTQFCQDDAGMLLLNDVTIPNLCQCLGNPKFFIIRKEGLNCLKNLITSLLKFDQFHQLNSEVLIQLRQSLGLLSDDELKDICSLVTKWINSGK